MICAPASRTISGVSPLTVACVPTGMNTGVRTLPCGVWNAPARAAPSVASRVKENDIPEARDQRTEDRGQKKEEPQINADDADQGRKKGSDRTLCSCLI